MNETLSVIQEHISDMNTSLLSPKRIRSAHEDSGSEYSNEHRLSYINGAETDEEEEILNAAKVKAWTPDQVADYLADSGVEAKHCDVFREQEISGDVLLEMDQTSVFIKEFDLGSVGRRLKTWQKIKALQDDVRQGLSRQWKPTRSTDGNKSSEDMRRERSSTASAAPAQLRRSMDPSTSLPAYDKSSSSAPNTIANSPAMPADAVFRPSAASIRDLHQSRRDSDRDGGSTQPAVTQDISPPQSQPLSHRKHPSFDRNWKMGGDSRPMSSIVSSKPSTISSPDGQPLSAVSGVTVTSPFEFERGYFSGADSDSRSRNVLRKRGSNTHVRNSSYTEDTRRRSGNSNIRHSRFGSAELAASSASVAQKYFGLGSRRNVSVDTITSKPQPPPKDELPSPRVTNLEAAPQSATSSPRSSTFKPGGWFSPIMTSSSASRLVGLRAASDGVEGVKSSNLRDGSESPIPSDSLKSPSRTTSSTTSKGPSLDLDSSGAKSSLSTQQSKRGRKSKKETSAYMRGLEHKSPREQMVNCDYSGWMKKKSTNLMTTWKPRLFVLRGRRLSYYYSEDDTEEKGLIDISFHRVLPADNDRLTGLHATLTGASASPTSPAITQTPTMASTDAAAESNLARDGPDQMFIFKLVPPRTGLSRAVNFTRPTVHYFAVPNVAQGRLWMAALMKATIDRDEAKSVTTTYQQKTISLAKARMLRHRPPALMGLDEDDDGESTGLNIQGISFDARGDLEGAERPDSAADGAERPDSAAAGRVVETSQ
jgi:hypothetical protein